METNLLESPVIMVNTCTCSKCGPCARICPTKVFNAKNGDEMVISHTEECVLCIQQNQRK
jgi:NAD-dependent dihydropyrimidine dehydrogenase PreA subunit